MKNLFRPIIIGLMMCLLLSTTNAQSIDLKVAKAQTEAESVKKFTDSLVLYYNLVSGATSQNNNNKVLGADARARAEKLRGESSGYLTNLEGLFNKLKLASQSNDQFDADVNALLGSNKVKAVIKRVGGARKLFNSGLNSTSINNLRKDVTTVAETLQIIKNEDVCRYVAIGIVTEALLNKKATTANDKFYENYGCAK